MAREFAEGLGISHQAFFERLRRAHATFVENAVVIGRGTEFGSERDGALGRGSR